MVKKAGKQEVQFYRDMDTFTVVPVAECLKATWRPPIDVRWVDHNKGDRERPQIRSRLVAKHHNTYKDMDLYAATPPTESPRTLVSIAASGHDTKRMTSCAASRAYTHAACRFDVLIR